VECHTLGLPGGARGGLRALSKARRAIGALKPDVVHSQGIRADLLAMFAPCPRIATIRNFPQLDYPATYGPMRGRAMSFAHRLILKSGATVVAVSEAVAQNLRHGIPDILVIRNGVNTKRFAPAEPRRRALLRGRLSLPPDAFVWVSCGHLSRRKNPLLLLDAWMKRPCEPDGRILLMLGDGEMGRECRDMAAGRDDVVFRGRVPNVSEYLACADGFVSASMAEGLPNAVIEAAACGLPLVLSDIGPHREIAAAAPGIGRLFRPDDAEDAAAAMDAVETDGAGRMGAAARQAALSVFGAGHMSHSYQRLYLRLMEAGA
jgi:glycosyltransferase involved in cell wall biosynthesis